MITEQELIEIEAIAKSNRFNSPAYFSDRADETIVDLCAEVWRLREALRVLEDAGASS